MKILVVDDNVDFSTTMADVIKLIGFDADAINSPQNAIDYIKTEYNNIAMIFLDVEFGFGEKLDGLQLLDIFRRNYPSIPVVMITGKGTIETAVKATKLGAINFVEKNVITRQRIKSIIETTLIDAVDDTKFMRTLEQSGIIGVSNAIKNIGKNIIRFAKTDLNVLITGDTGTGKNLIADCLYKLTNSENELLKVSIPALPPNYKEELFGSIYGEKIKTGLFHKANNGTLFLDGIDELSADMQAQLLTPIVELQATKVGGNDIETFNIRFISTASKDLVFMTRKGIFSEQLYHKLRECEINIPPLEDRKEDIPHLVNYCVKQYNQDNFTSKYFTPSAIDYLIEQRWHGNVRELNTFVRLCLQTITNDALEATEIIKLMPTHKAENKFNIALPFSAEKTLKEDLAEINRIKIENTLAVTSGNVSKAAALLGVARETLYLNIKKYNVNVNEFRKKR